jgi:branched-chain amino acid transport system substrate-binding protein
MKFLRIIILLFVGSVLLFIVCCKQKPSETVQPATIKIGAIYPFTGNCASAGKDMQAALDLAVEVINQSFEIPIPLAKSKGLPSHENARIEIIYKDSQGDETRAGQLVEEMIHKDKVVALIGCYNSNVTAAASEQAEILKVPFLNPDSTSPVLTQRGLKWFFRTTPDDSMFAQNFFTFFTELHRKMNISVPGRLILVYENRLWGTSVSRVERKLSVKYDYQIAGDIPYDSKAVSVDTELNQIREALPGVILQSSYDDDAVLFMKGYKEKQINPTAILAMDAGFISPSFLEKLGRDGEYILSREVWALDIGHKKPIVTIVNDLFKKQYGRNMNGNSARAFTGLMVLANAINRARSLEPDNIRRAILDTKLTGDELIMPWDGVAFDPATGQNFLGKGIIVQVQDGQYRTVWPWELSESNVIWPIPAWSERSVGNP